MKIKDFLRLYETYNFLNENFLLQEEPKRKSVWFKIFTSKKNKQY